MNINSKKTKTKFQNANSINLSLFWNLVIGIFKET